MPLVTVMIAVHNRAEYFRILLQSLRRSTFTDFDLIVVDDASTEDLHGVTDAFADPRIRYFRQEVQQGCWAAFNRAIRESRTEWLCAIGSDDVVTPEFLARMADAARNAGDIDYLYPESFRIINSEGVPTGDIRRFNHFNGEGRRQIPALIFQHASGPVPHAGAWIHRRVYDRFGVYAELPNVQDTVFIAHHSQEITFRPVITDSGYHYRVHEGNISKSKLIDRHRSLAGAIEWMLRNLQRDTVAPTEHPPVDEAVFRKYVVQVLTRHSRKTPGGEFYRAVLDRFTGSSTTVPEPAPAPRLSSPPKPAPTLLPPQPKPTVQPAVVVVRTPPAQRKRIAVVADQNNRTFLRNFAPYLQSRHEVRLLDANRGEDLQAALEWADATWVEWTERLAKELSLRPRRGRLVCRLHSYEAYLPVLKDIRYDNLDALIFSSPQVLDYVVEKHPASSRPARYISEGVDLQKFPFKTRNHGSEVLFLGHLIPTKGPSLLMQAFRMFLEHVPNGSLHIVGDYVPDAGIVPEITRRYFEHIVREMGLAGRVHFYRGIPHEQLVQLMQGANYIMSTSFREGLPFSLLEAMATGLMPLIHNWPGAGKCFPAQYLFNYIGEIPRILSQPYDSIGLRRFVEEGHNLTRSLPAMEKILIGE
jgi:glycosyltransferase involved in cell wall biosynthesis